MWEGSHISEIRDSGLGLVGPLPWGSHFCQLYRSAEDLIDILVPYFAAGLRDNEMCLWATSQPLEVDAARDALAGAVGPLDAFTASGQLRITSYREWYTPGDSFNADLVVRGWLETEALALRRGFTGLRTSGNISWLERGGWDQFAAYESTVDRLLGHRRILALCTYQLAACEPCDVVDVIANHQLAIMRRNGQWRAIRSEQRRRTEEALRETSRRYETLFTAMSEGCALHEIICDGSGRPVDYRFLDVNPAFERLTGLSREQVVGRTMREVRPEDEPLWLEIYGRVALTGVPAHFGRFSRSLGRYHDVCAYCPAPGQFATVFMEMTHHKETEDSLRAEIAERAAAQAALLRERNFASAVVDTAGALVIVLDPRGRILRFNRACEECTGYTADEVRGRYLWDMVIPPEEIEEVHDLVRRLAGGELPNEHENHWMDADGTRRLIRWTNTAIFGDDGTVQHLIGTGIDITAQRRAAEEIRSMARFPEENPNPVLRVDAGGTLLYSNPAAHTLLKAWGCRVGERPPENIRDLLAASLAAMRPQQIELPVGRRVFSVVFAPIPCAGYVNLYACDVTDQKRAEAQLARHRDSLEELVAERTDALRQSMEQLRRSERLASIGIFATGIAHELNNPLNNILLSAESARHFRQDFPLDAALESIVQEAQRAGDVVKSLLTFARQETTAKVPSDVNEVIRHAIQLAQAYAHADGLEFETHFHEKLPHVLMNRIEIEQVIVNLIQNAHKAAGGAVRIAIRTDAGNGDVWVTLKDNGPGIDEQHLPHIFDPFFTTRRNRGGTGLGLSICHSIVADHGGSIVARSKKGRGAKFTIRLPEAEAARCV